MTTAFDRWVSEAIQDLGGDGAKYLSEKRNVVSLTDWKNLRYNGRVKAGKHDTPNPLRFGLSGVAIPQCLPAESLKPKRVFCFLGRPKHDSELPQVGQNFKEPRHGSQQWQGAIPKVRGASRITKPGELETTMVIRTRGVNPSSAQGG